MKKWTIQQNQTAIEFYTTVIDLEFPNIDPFEYYENVLSKAEKTIELCIDLIKKHPQERNAVHIMGEYTYTYAVVNGLLKNGIECISSTTERIVEEEGDKKITIFKFVKIREYKSL